MHESPETLARPQQIIDRSAATAGPAVRRNFIGGGWSMSAEEFLRFWGVQRMASIATVSTKGLVYTAPLDLRLVNGRFYLPTFADSQRLRNHRVHPRCAITSWEGPYRAVIVYGTAEVVETNPTGRTEETACEQDYRPEEMVTIAVTPARIYAIRPPEGHPAAG